MAEATPAAQAAKIRAVFKKEFQVGDTAYIVESTWFNNWKRHVNYDVEGADDSGPGGPPPGPIDNKSIVSPSSLKGWRRRVPLLSSDVREDVDYDFVSEGVWQRLVEWYGGGPALPRAVKPVGIMEEPKVQTVPQPIVVYTAGSDGEPVAATDESKVTWDDDSEEDSKAAGGAGAGGEDSEAVAIEGAQIEEGDISEDAVAVLLTREETASGALKLLCSKLRVDFRQSRLWIWAREAGTDGGRWILLSGNAATLSEVYRNDSFAKVMVETKGTDGWLREEAAASSARHSTAVTDVAAWRLALKVGDRCDAQDSEKKWFESVVTEEGTADGKPAVKVHFRAWSSKWDLWIGRDSPALAPPFTKLDNFRDFRANDKLEVKLPTAADGVGVEKWFPAQVEKFDDTSVTVKATKHRKDVKKFDRDTEKLCPYPTHCKRDYRESQIQNSNYSSYGSSYGGGWSSYRTHTEGRPLHNGAVGLVNLGNTCFMNSMLQCLSNTKPLTEWFLDGSYRDDINTSNPLGMGGRLAEAYGGMLDAMWGGKYRVVCPSDLKTNIGKHAPQFAGYQQQDSQELMNFLLDGLHEDCNRVHEKPYREKVEGDGRPDTEVADLAWQAHLDRNKSQVLDIFGGQLRSQVDCDQCDKTSITFDPFLSFSAPVPYTQTRDITFTVYPYDGDVPTQYRPQIPQHGSIHEMKEWCQKQDGIEPDELLVCPLMAHRLEEFFNDGDPVTRIRVRDIIVGFRIPPTPTPDEEEKGAEADAEPEKKRGVLGRVRDAFSWGGSQSRANRGHPSDPNQSGIMQVCFRRPDSRSYYRSSSVPQLFGEPRVVSLFAASGKHGVFPTNNELHELVWQVVHRMFKRDEGEWSAEDSPYVLKIAPKGPYYDGVVVPRDDEPVKVDKNTLGPIICVDVTAEAMDARCWDDAAYKACTLFKPKKDAKKEKTLQLRDCFSKAFEKEQLGEADKWYCSSCKEHRRAYKKFDLWRLPQVLVIHLKRFQYSAGYLNFVSRSKIDCQVDFPEVMDISSFMKGPVDKTGSTYRLYAVSNHMGGLGGGHYTAYAKNFLNDTWYSFDDSSVSAASVDRVATPYAYVLFYLKDPGATVERPIVDKKDGADGEEVPAGGGAGGPEE